MTTSSAASPNPAHKPSVAAYFEPRYNINSNWQLYAGLSGESIKFANNAAAEIDFYGGVRPTFGPLAFDFGYLVLLLSGWRVLRHRPDADSGSRAATRPIFPNGNVAKIGCQLLRSLRQGCLHAGPTWAFGANFYYSPNFLNTGADGEYLSGTIKFTAPEKMALGGRSAGTCRVSSAINGWAPAIRSTADR